MWVFIPVMILIMAWALLTLPGVAGDALDAGSDDALDVDDDDLDVDDEDE